jgi:hypothetical protein
LEIDALYYRLDLLEAGRQNPPADVGSEWQKLKEQIQDNRRHDTGEFQNPLAMLSKRLDTHFDLADLGDLAFNLNVDLEKTSSIDANKIDIIIDLITHFQKRERLDILIKAAHGARPDLESPFIEFLGAV